MKRVIICLYLLSVLLLSGLDSTRTIEYDDFISIKNACVSDNIISYYYQKCLGRAELPREDWEYWLDEMSNRDYQGIGSYANLAMVGAIDVEPPENALLNAYDFLLTSDPSQSSVDDYLSMSTLQDSIFIGDGNPTFNLFYALNSLSLLVDMIWFYDGAVNPPHYTWDDYHLDLSTKLDSIASLANTVVNSSMTGAIDYIYTDSEGEEHSVRFSTGYNNIRLNLLGALGYAGCVLDSTNYINHVDYELLDRSGYDENIGAILEHLIQYSGMYAEGLHYQSYTMGMLVNYFTARKRIVDTSNLTEGVLNYYNNPHIKNMIEESFHLICPDLSFMNFDDCWKVNTTSSNPLSPETIRSNLFSLNGVIQYCFQQDDPFSTEVLENLEWYLNDNYFTFGKYPKVNKQSVILSYNSSRSLIYEDPGVIPENLGAANYSNEEFTILRDSMNTRSEFRENLAVFVNHENYESYKIWHEHADQTSFSMYYKGRNLTLS